MEHLNIRLNIIINFILYQLGLLDEMFPCAFISLKNKNELCYEKMLKHFVRHTSHPLAPRVSFYKSFFIIFLIFLCNNSIIFVFQTVHGDFEKSMHNAFKTVFTACDIK